MAYVRVDMKDGDFRSDKFLEFRQATDFEKLANDWGQFEAILLNIEIDMGYLESCYEESPKTADENDIQLSLLLDMYTSKSEDLISTYPTIRNYFMYLIKMEQNYPQRDRTSEQSNLDSSASEQSTSNVSESEQSDGSASEQLNFDSSYNEKVIDFHQRIVKLSQNYAPADFAVLFIEGTPELGPVDFYERPPGVIKRATSYKGVKLSFTRKIICEVFDDERMNVVYTHLRLPKFFDNFINSVLPGKRLTKDIKKYKTWEIPTPYNLSDSVNTEKVVVPTKIFHPLSLCSIEDLNIISYDTDDLDIRTFADLIFTW